MWRSPLLLASPATAVRPANGLASPVAGWPDGPGFFLGAGDRIVGPPKSVFTSYDLLVLATLVAQTFSLVRVPLLPIAISSALAISLVVLAPRAFLNGLSLVVRVPFLASLMLIFLLQAAGDSFLELPFYYAAASTARQFIGASSLVSFLGYFISHSARPQRFLTVLLTLLAISQIWYFCELRMPDRFIPIRAQLYADLYILESYERSLSALTIARGFRTGLVPRMHGLGYVSCAALAYASLALLLATRWRRTRANIFLLGLAALSLATLYYSLQRSAVLGAIAGLGLLYLGPFKVALAARLPVVAVIIALAAGAILPSAVSEFTKPQTDIISKTLVAQDYGFRLGMQAQALKLVVQCPLGLRASGKTWEEHGYGPVAQRYGLSSGTPLAVHNGYLGVLLNYGWIGAGLVITFLVSAGKTILRVVRHPTATPAFPATVAAAVAATAFGLIFIQSMFHNASVMNREPVSTAFVAMLGYLAVFRLRGRSRPSSAPLRSF
jgi:O-antigen ligase